LPKGSTRWLPARTCSRIPPSAECVWTHDFPVIAELMRGLLGSALGAAGLSSARRMAFHLAQINIGRAVGPIDGPLLAEFHALLDPVNALADAAPGFVWRLQTDEGNATALRPYDDDRIIVNMSTWESIEALRAFVYSGMHVGVLRRRREWFERFPTSYLALWWLPAGLLPTVEDAKLRLESLDVHGPTPYAFTLRQTFAPEPVAA
jgi:uncharacterized protein DUF3291